MSLETEHSAVSFCEMHPALTMDFFELCLDLSGVAIGQIDKNSQKPYIGAVDAQSQASEPKAMEAMCSQRRVVLFSGMGFSAGGLRN